MFWVQNKLTLWILGYVFSVTPVGGFVCMYSTCVDSFIVVGVVGVLKVEPNDDAEYLKIAFDFSFCVETSPPN